MYFLSNLLVLYGSRIREFSADEGSVRLSDEPHLLAGALYKLVYGSARAQRDPRGQYDMQRIADISSLRKGPQGRQGPECPASRDVEGLWPS
jgi:Zn-dependent protease with chaperone function